MRRRRKARGVPVAMETTLTLIATGTLVALRRRMMLGAQLLGPTGGRP